MKQSRHEKQKKMKKEEKKQNEQNQDMKNQKNETGPAGNLPAPASAGTLNRKTRATPKPTEPPLSPRGGTQVSLTLFREDLSDQNERRRVQENQNKDCEDHITERRFNSMSHFNLEHKPISRLHKPDFKTSQKVASEFHGISMAKLANRILETTYLLEPPVGSLLRNDVNVFSDAVLDVGGPQRYCKRNVCDRDF